MQTERAVFADFRGSGSRLMKMSKGLGLRPEGSGPIRYTAES